jgi:PIN domain nuclease of toxin-antitoxin system
MSGVVADTHGLIWFLKGSPSLSALAKAAMVRAVQSGGSIVIASITLVEVAYLVEKGRIAATTFDLFTSALANPVSGFVLAALDLSVAEALRLVPRVDVPDMPDRIIAATALHLGLPLVSRDRKIQASAIQTIW